MSIGETFSWMFPNTAQAGIALLWAVIVFLVSLKWNNQTFYNKRLNMAKYGLCCAGGAMWAVSLRLLNYEPYPFRSAALFFMVWLYTVSADWLSFLWYHWSKDTSGSLTRALQRQIEAEHDQH